MREIARQTTKCFARGCPVVLFTDYGVPMDAVLKSIADGMCDGPDPSGQARYWYAIDLNRCYCPDHGRQYMKLAQDLPLALQELSALAGLYPDYRTKLSELDPAYQNVRRAEDRVARLRQVETELVPLVPSDNGTATSPVSLHTHAGNCLQCYDNLGVYRKEFRSLFFSMINREPLDAELLAKMRAQLCDVGKSAFNNLLSQLQASTSARQS